jgi:hypothetical protein
MFILTLSNVCLLKFMTISATVDRFCLLIVDGRRRLSSFVVGAGSKGMGWNGIFDIRLWKIRVALSVFRVVGNVFSILGVGVECSR